MLVKRYNNGRHAEFIHLTFQEFFAARYAAKAIKAFNQGKPHSLSGDDLLDFIAKTKWNNFYEVMWWFVAGRLGGKSDPQLNAIEMYKLRGGDANQAQELTIPKSHQRLQTLQTFFDLLLQEPRAELELLEITLLSKCYAEAGAPNIMQKDAIKLHYQTWLNFYWTSNYASDLYTSSMQKLSETAKNNPVVMEWSIASLKFLIKFSELSITDAITSLGLPSLISTVFQDDLLALLQDETESIRADAARAVSRLGLYASDALQQGVCALMKDISKEVRAGAAQAVGALAESANLELQQELIALLQDQEWYVRHAAIKAIVKLESLNKSVIKALHARVLAQMKDPDSDVRKEAARTVGALGPAASEILQQGLLLLMEDPEWDVRFTAAQAVAILGPAANMFLQAGLFLLLKDKYKYVRRCAVKAIGTLGSIISTALKQGLSVSLKDKTFSLDNLAAQAVNTFELIKGTVLEQNLIALMQDNDIWSRALSAHAVRALGPTANEDLQKGLSKLIGDKEAMVRFAATQAIGALGFSANDSVRLGLASLAKDQNSDVRCAVAHAISAVGLISDSILVLINLKPTLHSLMNDEVPEVRAAAAQAVGELSVTNALQNNLPEKILISPYEKKYEDSFPTNLLEELLILTEHEASSVRHAAAAALGKTSNGLTLLCQKYFKYRPAFIPPSGLILSSKDIVQVNHKGKLQCLKLCGTVLQNMVQDGSAHNLTHEHWTIALVRKKPAPVQNNNLATNSFFSSLKGLTSHAFLLVEGIKNGVRFAQKIDLYATGGDSSSQSGRQKITIEVTDITDFNRLQQLAENSYCMVQGVFKDKIAKLMQLIEEDQAKAEHGEIVYNLTGDGSILSGQAKKHSCISWCLEKWQQIGLPLKRKWFDSLVVVPAAYLPAPSKENEDSKEGSCLVM